ncbi:amidohydrolase family protein [Streptomyces montanisoli]|uniref:Amidohydrolase family protein n=1 Tax=Streptomyces montanisoli TaxID=2798581 RepID=A0A940M6Q2_9ACTN|nr:amidohydrolase family protein [Streptomyces montanisoli]MBP0457199.1 amidohydrolase family protein [Streptomyces montanisoli]
MDNREWTRRGLLKATAAGAALASVPAALGAPGTAAAAERTTGGRPERVALTNVRVFDGRALSAPRTVVIDGGVIGLSPFGARTIDGKGATLLPGLIDAHVHLEDVGTLEQLTGYGVTTALDMACWPPSLVDSLRHRPGLTDIRSAGVPATAPGSTESMLPGFPQSDLVDNPAQAPGFVAARVAEGSDYIKIIVDVPGGLDQATINALSAVAHAYGKLANAHTVTSAAVDEALLAGVDVIHHVPLDTAVTSAVAARYAAGRRVSVPTLTVMEGFGALGIPGLSYAAARDSVIALHKAGVRILAGTDSNRKQGIPVQPAFGAGLHHELELLVAAGLSTVDALRATTVLPAQTFGLHDRGVISPGRRADLVLVDGDPVSDIRTTRNIQRVWAGGIEYAPVA